MRVAVLDLGTNTFNLVVAEKQETGSFQILHNSKLPVKLGEKGINKGEITETAFNRGVEAVKTHFRTILEYRTQKTIALGTSALRTAVNGNQFIQLIKKITGIEVDIIPGNKEAELIYYGVRQTHPMKDENYLILDIGGGSNEFIIADRERIHWKHSYEIGMARLLEKFNPSDPIKPKEVEIIKDYISGFLTDLEEQIRKYNIKTLLGASGSFETFVSMIRSKDIEDETRSPLLPQSTEILPSGFFALYEKLIVSTAAERKHMKGLEPMRIEMIVIAALFVKFILEKFGIKQIFQSNFSMKEGAIVQLFKDQ